MKKDDFDHAIRMQERREIRKRNISDYFLNRSTYHRPWLQELAERYKCRGEFPLMPMVLLPSYYNNIHDREIAVFAALLISENAEFDKIQSVRNLLGDKPFEWFQERGFVRLSIGREQNKRNGGVENWKIAKLFDRLWQEHFNKTTKPAANIGYTIKLIADIQYCSYFDVLTYLLNDCCVGNYFYKLRLLLMVLGTGGGFGLNLWSIPDDQLQCPLADGIRDFIVTWFPDYNRIGSVDDAIRLFGFERECDFFYAYLGYKELQKRNPKECGEKSTKYLDWYEHGYRKKPYQWRSILPEICF